jgi:RNA polymerase sigma factor (sigma-70 family)
MLHGLARTLVNGPDADDLVQETLVRGLEHGHRARHVGSYLRRICRNLFAAGERSRVRRETRERAQASELVAPDEHEIAEHRNAVRTVAGAVASLPDHEYEVVRLRFYEGIKPSEITERLGLPLSTVKRRLERAVERMRHQLAHELGDTPDWRRALLPLCAWPSGVPPAPIPSPAAGGLSMAKVLVALTISASAVLTAFMLRSGDESVRTSMAGAAPLAAGEPSMRSAESALTRTDTDPPHSDLGPSEKGTIHATVLWSDGTPAAGAWLIRFGRFPRHFMTDGTGQVTIPDVEPGRFALSLCANGNGYAQGEVTAGGETSVTIQFPVGQEVMGRVVDRSGEPVEDAEIYVGLNDSQGWWIARTDASGAFHLRDVFPTSYRCAARARGHAPSAISLLRGNPGERTQITLELGGASGTVSGTVLDDDGNPVGGATVMLIPNQGFGTAVGWNQQLPPVQEMTADEEGEFEFTSAISGTNTILVKAPGSAPWRGPVEVAPGSSASVDVRLPPESVWSGVVRAADGTPVGGADLAFEWEPEEERSFDSIYTAARDDGSFRIDSLPAGEFHPRASKSRFGKTNATVVLQPGRETVSDLVLDPGRILRGRVVSDRGEPLEDCGVTAVFPPPPGSRQRSSTRGDRTDSQGQFSITNCDAEVCALRVSQFIPPYDVRLLAELAEVKIDGSEVTVTVGPSTSPSSFITGTVQDADGRPAPAHIGVMLVSGDTRTEAKVDPSTGRFEAGPLETGSYTVNVQRSPVGFAQKIPCELHRGERLDLGTLHLPACGSVRLVLENRDAIPGTLTIRLGQPPGATWATVDYAEGDWPQTLDLLPGDYGFEVMGARLVAQNQRFTITAGSETVVTMSLVRGFVQTFSFALDPEVSLDKDDWIFLSILDGNGRRLAGASTCQRAGSTTKVVLPPGTYTLRANTGSIGQPSPGHPTYSGEQTITVNDQDEEREWRTVLKTRAR